MPESPEAHDDLHGYDDLVVALRGLGDRLDLPPADPVAAAIDRIRGHSPRFSSRDRLLSRPFPRTKRVLAAVAAVILVAVAGVLAAPGSRDAVARWLGIGRVTVTYTDDVPATAGRTYDLGTPVPLARAVARADQDGWTLAAPRAAGDPARAFVGVPAGSVALVWAPSADLPEIDDSGIGLLLGAIPGTTDAGSVSKQATAGTTIELVRVDDNPAYWIAGDPHEVTILDPEGDTVPDAAHLAGNTLIWTGADVTYRLESALDRDEAVELASTLRRLP
jgi:hypothetical protein